jgi:formylglycine-generating enzyme required for sulfatase activity
MTKPVNYLKWVGMALLLVAPLVELKAQEDVRRTAPQKDIRVVPLPSPPKKAPVSKPRLVAGPKLVIKVPVEKIDLPEMLTIPGEVFTMGAYDGQPDEAPAHQVQLINFEISKYPISNKQFRQFVESTNYKTDAEREPTALEQAQKISWRTFAAGRDNYPVVWVSANDANAFCRWLTLITTANNAKGQVIEEEMVEKNLGLQGEILRLYRLPTEAEWEFAARGDLEATAYPWGDLAERDKLNCNWDNRPDTVEAALKYIKPIGHQPANRLHLQDIVGNVAQWCIDYYAADFYKRGAESAYAPYGPDEGTTQVVRGGSWWDLPENCRVFSRHFLASTARNTQTGFRVARTGERTFELNSDTDSDAE